MRQIVNSVDDLIELARRIKAHQEEITLDTETNGLFPMEDSIVGWSIAFSETEGYYIPRKNRGSINVPDHLIHQLFELLQGKKLIFHNAKFDIEMIFTNFGLKMPIFADTMAMAYLACFPKLGLKDIMHNMFHYETKEFNELLTEKYGKNWKKLGFTAADLTAEEIADYAVHDVLYTYKLYNLLKNEMQNYKSIFKLEMNLIPIVAQMDLSGITIDSDKMRALGDAAKIELKDRFDKMQEAFNFLTKEALDRKMQSGFEFIPGTNLEQEDLVPLSTLYGKEFKPGSVPQVRSILIEGCRMPILKRTDKSAISTDAEVLEQYVDMGCDFAKQLMEYRSLYKYISSYLDKIPEICDHTGLLYANFKALGTDSGRFKSDGVQNWQGEDRTVNLQNQPNGGDYDVRSAYIAPPGWTWIKADYKQQEYRAMCNIAGEQGAIQKFRDGVDFHSATARFMFDIPDSQEVPHDLRQTSKAINFGLNYGMSVATLAKKIGRTVPETKALYEKYFENLPKVQALSQWAYNQVEQTEMIKTYFGRLRKLPWRTEGSRRADMIKNSAFNTMIQGTSADITKIAMLRVQDRVLDKFGPELVQMKLQVHDELDFIVRNDHLDEIAAAIKNAMTIPTPQDWVDFEVDLEIGPSWSEAEHEDWTGEFITDQFTGWGDLIPHKYQSYLTIPDYSVTW